MSSITYKQLPQRHKTSTYSATSFLPGEEEEKGEVLSIGLGPESHCSRIHLQVSSERSGLGPLLLFYFHYLFQPLCTKSKCALLCRLSCYLLHCIYTNARLGHSGKSIKAKTFKQQVSCLYLDSFTDQPDEIHVYAITFLGFFNLKKDQQMLSEVSTIHLLLFSVFFLLKAEK